MKTLKGIIGTETSVVSMIKFTGDFDIIYNASNAISIRLFDDNNAKTVHNSFIDDCDKDNKAYLKNTLVSGKVGNDYYVNFLLDVKSNLSFDVTYKDDYTIVSIVAIKNVMQII